MSYPIRIVCAVMALMVMSAGASAGVIRQANGLGDGCYEDYNYFGHSYAWSGGATSNGADYYYDGPPAMTVKHWTYIQINIAGLGNADDITGVSLNLNVVSMRPDAAGNGGHLKIATVPAAASGDASQRISGDLALGSVPGSASGWFACDVTAPVKNLVANGYAWACFSIDPATSGGGYRSSGMAIGAAEGGLAPYLSFIVVPEPASIGLLVAGAVGLLARRR